METHLDSNNKKKHSSMRWDLILRYRLIEIISQWEGRLTTNHLQHAFGIGRSQASKIINQYILDISSSNLYYDTKLKGYAPTNQFKPQLTRGDINEYLNLLNSQGEHMSHFAGLDLEPANTEVIMPIIRSVDAKIVRHIVQACRENQRLEIEYSSLTSEKDYRNIAPHTLVFNGYRWHVRAFCEKSGQYRDFVLSRMTNVYDFVGESEYSITQDAAWNTPIEIQLKPDSRLSDAQQAVISRDFGMIKNRLIINTRGAMVQYILQFLRVSTKAIDADPKAQQVVIENMTEVKKWLFS